MKKKHPLEWNGGQKPKEPVEGLAVEVGLETGVIRRDPPGAMPRDRTRPSGRVVMPKESS